MSGEPPEPDPRERLRRVARVQMALGVPALMVLVVGIVVGFRMADRDPGDPILWFVLGPLVAVFAAYYMLAWHRLRRSRQPEAPKAQTGGEKTCRSEPES